MANAPKPATTPANVTVLKCKTRVDENSPTKVETAISVEWDDENATRMFAARGVVIAAQSIFRASGDIPAEYSVKVSELAKRERGGFTMKPTAQNAGRLMAKLSDDEYRAALVALGITAREVERMVTARTKSTPTTPAKK